MSRSDLIDLEVFVLVEREKAWGIADPFKAGNLIWVPRSRCEMSEVETPSKRATITAPEPYLKEKGLI